MIPEAEYRARCAASMAAAKAMLTAGAATLMPAIVKKRARDLLEGRPHYPCARSRAIAERYRLRSARRMAQAA